MSYKLMAALLGITEREAIEKSISILEQDIANHEAYCAIWGLNPKPQVEKMQAQIALLMQELN